MKKILLIVLALCIVSCDKTNKNLIKNDDKQLAEMVVKGKTTKEEVKKMFGEPNEKGLNENGKEKWMYVHNETSMNPMNYIPVTKVLIGKDGKVRKLVIIFDKDVVYEVVASSKDDRIQKGLLNMGSK